MTLAEFITQLQKYPQDMEVVITEVNDPRWHGTIGIGQFLVDNPSANLVGIFSPSLREMVWSNPETFKLIGVKNEF